MSLANRDRVLETSATVGTGAYTLAGAVVGFQSFAAVGDGNSCQYSAWEVDANGNPSGGWECGLGTYTAAGTLLARSSVYASSNGGAAVSWTAGTRRVAVCPQTNGTLVVRQSGGTPGVNEVQVSHDGTVALIENKNSGGGSNVNLKARDLNYSFSDGAGIGFSCPSGADISGNVRLPAGNYIGIGSGVPSGGSDVTLRRAAAKVWRIADSAGTAGATFASPPLSPAALAASQNDYNPGVARRYRLATDGSGGKSITGLAISQVDGQECSVVNVSAADAITLTHQDALSTAANRFICTGAANIVLAVNEEALLWYDGTTARWRARKV